MKKTIITLLALSGVATAETNVWDLKVYTNANGTTADAATTGNWDFYFGSASALTSYAFDFTVTQLNKWGYEASQGCTFFGTSRGDANGAAREGIGIYTNSEPVTVDGKNYMDVSIGTTKANDANNSTTYTKLGAKSITLGVGDSGYFAYDSVTGTAIIYNKTTQNLLEVTTTNDEKYYFESGSASKTQGASAVYTQGGKHYLTYGNIADLKGMGMAGDVKAIKNYIGVVPEPTTATLSLLALAGLAMRRRRK